MQNSDSKAIKVMSLSVYPKKLSFNTSKYKHTLVIPKSIFCPKVMFFCKIILLIL